MPHPLVGPTRVCCCIGLTAVPSLLLHVALSGLPLPPLPPIFEETFSILPPSSARLDPSPLFLEGIFGHRMTTQRLVVVT